MITSLQNEQIKNCRKLRLKKFREQQGTCILDGEGVISFALQANVALDAVFTQPGPHKPSQEQLLEDLRRKQVTVTEVSAKAFKAIAYGDKQEGLVAIARPDTQSLETWKPDENALYIILDQIEKPGNIGAVLRTADALGATGVIACNPLADLWNPNSIRASLGTCFTVPYCQADTQHLQAWLARHAISVFAQTPSAKTSYLAADLKGKVAFVGGSEHKGLGKIWLEKDVHPIGIPMRGKIDSLNISVAMTVVLYEAYRQRLH